MTGVKHFSNVKYQLASMYDKAIVLSEPISKNTAPAIALASKYIMEKFNIDPVILVVPSDHMINNTEKFILTVKEGEMAIYRFPLMESPYKRFVEVQYNKKKNAKSLAEKNTAKFIMNAAIGALQNHNCFLIHLYD